MVKLIIKVIKAMLEITKNEAKHDEKKRRMLEGLLVISILYNNIKIIFDLILSLYRHTRTLLMFVMHTFRALDEYGISKPLSFHEAFLIVFVFVVIVIMITSFIAYRKSTLATTKDTIKGFAIYFLIVYCIVFTIIFILSSIIQFFLLQT